MNRLFLIHWNDDELNELAQPLRAAGWQVQTESEDGARAGKAILADPPDAVVIYLTRLPSHGRETASYLRTKLGPDQLPIIFVEGQTEKLEQVQAKVPDAIFADSRSLMKRLENLR